MNPSKNFLSYSIIIIGLKALNYKIYPVRNFEVYNKILSIIRLFLLHNNSRTIPFLELKLFTFWLIWFHPPHHELLIFTMETKWCFCEFDYFSSSHAKKHHVVLEIYAWPEIFVWLISFNLLFSKFIHTIVPGKISFLFEILNNVLLVLRAHFIYPFANWWTWAEHCFD